VSACTAYADKNNIEFDGPDDDLRAWRRRHEDLLRSMDAASAGTESPDLLQVDQAAHSVTGDRIRVVVETPDNDDAANAGVTALRAPTGHLPGHVWGRDDLLARLCELTEAPDGWVHVLAGLGGTGKSTIALRVAEDIIRLGIRAWWVPTSDAGTVMAKLMSLARDLGAPPGEVAEALNGRRDPADLLWRFLQARPRWLLVFDNADDLGALAVGGNDVAGGAGWLRPSGAGLIVVTSREQNPQLWGRHSELHTVGWLDPVTGSHVLTDLAPEAGSIEEAAALSERLGGLPLALHHAGSQLGSPFAAERTFTEYGRALDARFERLMGHGAADDRAIVTRTWELSLDALAVRGRPQARPLLRVLSCMAPAVLIPPGMLDHAVLGRVCHEGADGVAEGLAALASTGLIATSQGPEQERPGVTVHPLVTETSRLHLDAEGPAQAGGSAVALLTAAAARLDTDRPQAWPFWVQLMPHLDAIYSYLADRLADDDLAALAEVTASATTAFIWAGSYLASQQLAQSALQYAARLGAEHPAVLSLRFQVASAYLFRGRHTEAEHEYREVLAATLRVLGPDHAEALQTRHQIARLLARQGQYERAEQEYREVLAAELRVLGPDSPDTLLARHEIARMLDLQGHHEQAEHEHLKVLAARQRVLGPDHPETLATRHQIAWMLAQRDKYEQAEQAYREVLAARQRVLGPDHPDTLATRHEIARMLSRQGQHERAKHEYQEVLATELRVLGPDHPHTRTTQGCLTSLENRLSDRG
jgi:tetratricopeptide (TPR) repeat protein